MPGPVSDSYDPEFGTGEHAEQVNRGLQAVVDRITSTLGPELANIVEVAYDNIKWDDGVAPNRYQGKHVLSLTEQELRLIRFGLLRALESI